MVYRSTQSTVMKTLTDKKAFIKDNLDKLSNETRPTLSQISGYKAQDLDLVDALVEEINSFVAPTEEETTNEPVEKVDNLRYETLTTDSGAQVEVVWLPFVSKGMRQDKQTKKVRTSYRFAFGVNMITTQNEQLKGVAINEGDLFPFKVDTIQPIASDRTYGYGKQVFSAGIAEFACDLLITKRLEKLEELEELAQLSDEAQELIVKATAVSQAEAYLAKKGLKMPSSMK